MNNLSFFAPVQYGSIPTADIFHNFNGAFKAIEPNYLLKEYSIRGNPRPETLSHMLYGTVNYYWVILLINNIYDPYYDWIQSDQTIHEKSEQKYQHVGGVNEIAYHQNELGERFWNVVEYPKDSGYWYDSRDVLREYLQYKGPMIPVTRIESELDDNEKRRVIKIVSPTDIKGFVEDFYNYLEANDAYY